MEAEDNNGKKSMKKHAFKVDAVARAPVNLGSANPWVKVLAL
jgi:hypothetical protein